MTEILEDEKSQQPPAEPDAPKRPGLFSKERWLNTALSGVQLLGNGAMMVSGIFDDNWLGRVLVPAAQSALAVVRLRGTMSTPPLEGGTRLEQAKDALTKPDSMWFQAAASMPLFAISSAAQLYEGFAEERFNQLVDTGVGAVTYTGAMVDVTRRVDEVNATAAAKREQEAAGTANTPKENLPEQDMQFSEGSSQVVGWKKLARNALHLATSRFTGYAAQAIALAGRTIEGVQLMGSDPNAAIPLLVNTGFMTVVAAGNMFYTEQKVAEIKRGLESQRNSAKTCQIAPPAMTPCVQKGKEQRELS